MPGTDQHILDLVDGVNLDPAVITILHETLDLLRAALAVVVRGDDAAQYGLTEIAP